MKGDADPNRSVKIEIEYYHKDGSVVWMENNVSGIRDKEGSVIGLHGLSRDIAERKHAELMLRELENHLEEIIWFFPDPTMVIDRQGKVTAWNHAMEELTGVKAEDMLGKDNYEYALPFYGERCPILIDLAMKQDGKIEGSYDSVTWHGNTISGENYITHLGSEKAYFQGSATALYNSHGRS
jgi:PAS domain S-box-containing protein